MLLKFWTSRIVTIKSATNPQTKLGLVLEEEVTAPSVPKSDKRVEFGLGFSDFFRNSGRKCLKILEMSVVALYDTGIMQKTGPKLV